MANKYKLITLDNLRVFKENIEKEIDTSGGSTQASDGIQDVSIEIEGADWKALGWTDLIKVTKDISTAHKPKFILDFTDMWDAIYEDCANGNSQSGSGTHNYYDVFIDLCHYSVVLTFDDLNISLCVNFNSLFGDEFETGEDDEPSEGRGDPFGLSFAGVTSSASGVNRSSQLPTLHHANESVYYDATGYIKIDNSLYPIIAAKVWYGNIPTIDSDGDTVYEGPYDNVDVKYFNTDTNTYDTYSVCSKYNTPSSNMSLAYVDTIKTLTLK